MAAEVTILVLREPGADPALPLPEYQTRGSAGADLRADLGGGELVLDPGQIRLVPTGLRVQIPEGYEMQVRPRSSLALKHGVTLPNTPGTIDSDYRGPLGVIMINLSQQPYTIHHGERIAQAVVAPVTRAAYVMAEALEQTARGEGGFGSTGRA
ncbi:MULTISPECIES: dUTP diphosphatase [Paracoccus]|jgi:dUTP pyrophosphatase|uniref:Deoxyuridine 5'-triphosphate nucleotidohydrolase n=1 Tax=Paracoccus denitrificans (strain Pd 1222) TaxID=318586 RepID=A1B3E5_PARDP|nr:MULTISPECIES: dUTP diphosphatase [Paracoccus]ABL70039.1 deoxyuridine 5'-triphosphate nucleotidohydrolase [Paracoccus denitrificans PD1222]MBB4627122.1 dUTP pyrophosphatase [Paracoccus denitrificans]MCU7430811.1 dUTP diphosphatase [Paracoccus denitrificans]MDK8871689.1 dUTP diphosphatase [Paracoccus sp. SSJ]QAR25418.1 dUTP diphosphatase [Paracoccus denitrificans]